MITNHIVIEVEKNHRKYQLSFYPGATLGEIYDVIIQMSEEVVREILNRQESMKPKEESEEKSDE